MTGSVVDTGTTGDNITSSTAPLLTGQAVNAGDEIEIWDSYGGDHLVTAPV
jgi:hypothetical protein